MRIARDFGTVSSILPEGTSLTDAPYTFFEAVRSALLFLSFDELQEHERPPKRMWTKGEQLNDWFEMVKKRRKDDLDSKSGGIEDPVDNDARQMLLVE